MKKRSGIFERIITLSLYIVIAVLISITFGSAIDMFLRISIDYEVRITEDIFFFVFGVLFALVGIMLLFRSLYATYAFSTQSRRRAPATSSIAMFEALTASSLPIPLGIVSWVFVSIHLVANGDPLPYYWVILIPSLLLFHLCLILLLGLLRSKLYSVSFTEYRRIGKEKLSRELKKAKERAKQVERKIKRKKAEEKKQKLLKAKNEAIRTSSPRISISSHKVPTQSARLRQLKQIVRRTKEMNLTDLRSLLVFRDKPSLMKWLYSLSDDWIFAIKGNLIVFEITDDDQKAPIIKVSEEIKEHKQKKQCLYCEANFVEVEDEGPIVCLNCGKKAPYCEVCKNIIIAGEKIVQVKSCKHVFHKKHIQEWIKVKGTCPICKEQINEESLRPFIPE